MDCSPSVLHAEEKDPGGVAYPELTSTPRRKSNTRSPRRLGRRGSGSYRPMVIGMNRLAATFGQSATTIHTVGIRLLGPRIRVPGKIGGTYQAFLGRGFREILRHFTDQQGPLGIIDGPRHVPIGEAPFGNPRWLSVGASDWSAFR